MLVYGTVTSDIHIEVFLGSMVRATLCAKRSLSRLGVKTIRIYLDDPPTRLDQLFHQLADLSLLRHPIAQTRFERFRNFNRIPIAYAFRPRLRTRLTLGGLTFPRKP